MTLNFQLAPRRQCFTRSIIIIICLLKCIFNRKFYVVVSVSPDSSVKLPVPSTLKSSIPQYRLGIRDSFMIAHSFHNHPSFGPAGGLHGATYTCDVEFSSGELHPNLNWVIDIGDASSILSQVLEQYNYKNLDEIFGNDIMTTTEFLCRQIHSDLCERLLKQRKIPVTSNSEICVKLWESHKAWASYTATII
jgi:6-pyruvoyltetrahydropterin/6-carboxytetrahydropterin synthase